MIVIEETVKEMIEEKKVKRNKKRNKEKIEIDHVQEKNIQIID